MATLILHFDVLDRPQAWVRFLRQRQDVRPTAATVDGPKHVPVVDGVRDK